jgi:hypothetical protein
MSTISDSKMLKRALYRKVGGNSGRGDGVTVSLYPIVCDLDYFNHDVYPWNQVTDMCMILHHIG